MSDGDDEKWASGELSDFVSVDNQKIFLRASGPARSPGDSAVIIVPGLGDSGLGWAAVAREVASFARVYRFDRPGLGHSPPSTLPRTATFMATELSRLLKITKVHPPYVVVGHSYGGIIAREFLALRPSDISGMVLVDTTTEDTPPLPYSAMGAIMNNIDYYSVAGYEADHKLTVEEWRELKEESERGAATTDEESRLARSSGAELGRKRQYDAVLLASEPLSVIKAQSERDLRKCYSAGLAIGNGTQEERETFLQWVGGLDEIERKNQREQLRLSPQNRFLECVSGHNVQLTDPHVIAEEIRWVLTSRSNC